MEDLLNASQIRSQIHQFNQNLTINLSEKQESEILQEIRKIFSDIPYFDLVAQEKLKSAIHQTNFMEISVVNTAKLVERYFDKTGFDKDGKPLWKMLNVIFYATYVLILCKYDKSIESLKLRSTVDLLKKYEDHPEFNIFYHEPGKEFNYSKDWISQELNYLLVFRNIMAVALKFIPSHLNKDLLMKICARLEGSGLEYISGGGSKPATMRRVKIYEVEGHVTKSERVTGLKRSGQFDIENTSVKANRNINVSMKRAIEMTRNRITEEDAAKLSSFPCNSPNNLKFNVNQLPGGSRKDINIATQDIIEKRKDFIIPQNFTVLGERQMLHNSVQSLMPKNQHGPMTRFFSTMSDTWQTEVDSFKVDPTLNLEQIRALLNEQGTTVLDHIHSEPRTLLAREISLDCSIYTEDLDALQDYEGQLNG
eukprot:gene8209-11108_t